MDGHASPDSWEGLEARISSEVILPGSAPYEGASRALNAGFDDVRPQAVVPVRESRRRRRGDAVRASERVGRDRPRRWALLRRTSSTTGLLVDVSSIRLPHGRWEGP